MSFGSTATNAAEGQMALSWKTEASLALHSSSSEESKIELAIKCLQGPHHLEKKNRLLKFISVYQYGVILSDPIWFWYPK